MHVIEEVIRLSPRQTYLDSPNYFKDDAFAFSNNGSRVTSENSTNCTICGDRFASNHYGAISCKSCKAFFRRVITSGRCNYRCSGDGRCDIDIETRVRCRSCRFKKCLGQGMLPEGADAKDYRESSAVKERLRTSFEADDTNQFQKSESSSVMTSRSRKSQKQRLSDDSLSNAFTDLEDLEPSLCPLQVQELTQNFGEGWYSLYNGQGEHSDTYTDVFPQTSETQFLQSSGCPLIHTAISEDYSNNIMTASTSPRIEMGQISPYAFENDQPYFLEPLERWALSYRELRCVPSLNISLRQYVDDLGWKPLPYYDHTVTATFKDFMVECERQFVRSLKFNEHNTAMNCILPQDKIALFRGNFFAFMIFVMARRSVNLQNALAVGRSNGVFTVTAFACATDFQILIEQILRFVVEPVRKIDPDDFESVALIAMLFWDPDNALTEQGREVSAAIRTKLCQRLEEYAFNSSVSGRVSSMIFLMCRLKEISKSIREFLQSAVRAGYFYPSPLFEEILFGRCTSLSELYESMSASEQQIRQPQEEYTVLEKLLISLNKCGKDQLIN